MDKVRLNNFILWCKGWYEPIDSRMNIIAQAQKILTLDDYISCNNPIAITLSYIDELVNKGAIKPVSLCVWSGEIAKYMSMFNVNYTEALLYRIKDFFAFECLGLKLIQPHYSRNVYKLGFIPPRQFGNSYKLANYKVNKFFNK